MTPFRPATPAPRSRTARSGVSRWSWCGPRSCEKAYDLCLHLSRRRALVVSYQPVGMADREVVQRLTPEGGEEFRRDLGIEPLVGPYGIEGGLTEAEHVVGLEVLHRQRERNRREGQVDVDPVDPRQR